MRFRGIDGLNRLWSRNGLPIEGAGHIGYYLDQMEKAAGEPWVFDGEFVVDGTLAASKAWFERGWRTGGEAGTLHLFDGLPYREWREGGTETPLYARKARLAELMQAVDADPILSWEYRPGSSGDESWKTAVRLVEDEWAFDRQDVLALANRVWAEGGEGVMCKDALAPYVRKRSSAWLKVKPGGPWARATRVTCAPSTTGKTVEIRA
jgi:ATP-dependent DNA ligase